MGEVDKTKTTPELKGGKRPREVEDNELAPHLLQKEITEKGPLLDNFEIPKYYTYTKNNTQIFVHPHAMKHLEELAEHGAGNPKYLRLLGQVHQKSINAGIDDIITLSKGDIKYRHMYHSGGNEFMFAAPRKNGDHITLIHFMPIQKNKK